MSAKELGMLHTVNFSQDLDDGFSGHYNHDIAGQLTEQLQRMVRQGQYFKVTGIDIGLQPQQPDQPASGTVTGKLRYYAPTRGRCEAYRDAFKTMAEAMKGQGISMRDNIFYDFRVPLRDTSNYDNPVPFANGATFNGVDELAMNKLAPNGVFQVHNESVQPIQTSATFSDGFGVYGSAGNEWVLNQNQQGFTGNHLIADEEFEAYRDAFKTMAEAMKGQGISMRDNIFYDFRVPLRDTSNYDNPVPFANGATFNGVDELAMNKLAPNGVFQVHNESVQPIQTSATFSDGFGVYGSAGNEWVLNQNQQGFTGNHLIADEEFEEIPFQVSLDLSTTQTLTSTLIFQWRPDPALYLAILAGQFELKIQETQVVPADRNLELTVSYTVAGWKSIMGNPDKKKSRSRKTSMKKAPSTKR